MAAQDAEAHPQMLLAILRGPDKEADMVLYRTQMPRGVAANVVHALKLASALADGRKKDVLQTMWAPNEQTGLEFAEELVRLLDDCTAVTRVCTGQVLREQARSTEVKKPRKLAIGLRHRLHGVCVHTTPGLTLRAGEIGSVRPFWAIRETQQVRTQRTEEGQGWDEILVLALKHLTARDVIGLCHLTLADVRQDSTQREVDDGGSAILPYLEDREKGLTDLCPTLRRLVEGCRLGWATMLPEKEVGRESSGGEEHGSLRTPDSLTVLREAIGENRGPKGSRGGASEAARESVPTLLQEAGGWRKWQDELREAVRQSTLSNSVEREEFDAWSLLDSQGPPVDPALLGGRTTEDGARVGYEEFPGYDRDSVPTSLPLTRIGQDAELGDEETLCSMDTSVWENYGGGDEQSGRPGITDWQQKRSSSSNSGAGAEVRRATGGGTPATHRREELALLGETRRQAVRFLGRGNARTQYW